MQAKETPLEDYLAQGGTAQVSMQALRDRVDTMLQQGGMNVATAAATTRTTRSRAATSGTGTIAAADTAATRTTRRGKAAAGTAAADNGQNMPPATAAGKVAGMEMPKRPLNTAMRKAQQGEVLYSVNGEDARPVPAASRMYSTLSCGYR